MTGVDLTAADRHAWAITRTATIGTAPTWAPSASRTADERPIDVTRDLPAIEVPRVVGGRYRLEADIGRGGFGQVWRAHDALTGERVAVKLCRALDDTHTALVRDEVTALQWANLPGVVRLRDDGFEGTTAWLVMDLVAGRPFPGQAPLAAVTARLLEVLARLHAVGVVHGDLKPANVLVDPEGRPTVLDLGIARGRALRAGDAPVTHLTLTYAAPEQLDERRVDARSDLYSVGVMVIEAAEARGVSLGAALAALCVALTHHDPADRPQSAAAALALLDDTQRVDAPPPVVAAATPAALVGLFSGPEAFTHHPSEAARALWIRTGGEPAAMARELRAWLRAGFAWRDGDQLAVRPEALARLVDGYPVAVDHPQPAASPAAADLLCWVRLAQPRATLARLRAVSAMPPAAFDAALAELRSLGAVWPMPAPAADAMDAMGDMDAMGVIGADDGIDAIATWTLTDPAPDWPLARLQRAHAALAASLPPDSAAAVRHAIAADYTTPGLPARVAAVARGLVLDGRLRDAQGLLGVGLDLARARERAEDEALLLPVCVLEALSREAPDALRHARYLVGRALARTAAVEALEALLHAAQAATPERVRALLAEIDGFADPDLERWRQAVTLVAARREGLDAEEAAVTACAAWAAVDRRRRWGHYLGWLGMLRYRQGRYREAAERLGEAAGCEVGRARALTARVDEAAAWLEAFEFDRAVGRAGRVAVEARGLRLGRVELSAVFIERSARYRRGGPLAAMPELVDAAAGLGTIAEAMIAHVEAAIAWRSGRPELTRALAARASHAFETEGRSEVAALARALAIRCGSPASPLELRALTAMARRCREADFGVQILGLLALFVAPGALADAAQTLAARGRPPAAWGHRLDVVSYSEALTLTGALSPSETTDA